MYPLNIKNNYTDGEKIKIITEKFRDIMEVLGLDLNNNSLKDTPKRVAKMFIYEIFKGLNENNKPITTLFDNEFNYNEMIVVKDIKVFSFCEHHFLPFTGTATIGYIPNNKVIGLSKISRIVDYFSRKPQIQERLTEEIWNHLSTILDTENIAVSNKSVNK